MSKMTDAESSNYYEVRFAEIPPDVLAKGVEYFRSVMAEPECDWPLERFRALFEQYGSNEWFFHIHDKPDGTSGGSSHFGWGMGLRNGLRSKADLSDDLLPHGNWDDYYVSVLEVALGFRPMPEGSG